MRAGSKFLLVGVICLSVVGCSMHSKKQSLPQPVPPVVKKIDALRSGKIVDFQRFNQGGKILFIPFNAGSNVEASAELDKTILMMIKTVNDVLVQEHSGFQILNADNARDRDLVINGYVVELEMPSRYKKFLPGKKNITMAIEGKMMDAETDEVCFTFSDRIEYPDSPDALMKIGAILGEHLGRFMVERQTLNETGETQ